VERHLEAEFRPLGALSNRSVVRRWVLAPQTAGKHDGRLHDHIGRGLAMDVAQRV
jgi:hypothetical protein